MASRELFIDLETIPPGAEEDFVITKSPPKTIKDPVKIEKWYTENRADLFRHQAVEPNRAHILCIGAAFDDDDAEVFHSENESVKEILNDFYEYIMDNSILELEDDKDLKYDIYWIGHNVRKFDLEVLWVSAMKHKHYELAKLISRHPYNKNVIDTMEIWSGPSRNVYTKLEEILNVLNLGSKMEGIDGSKVYDEYLAGNLYSKILPYVVDDVEKVRMIYRYLKPGLSL